MPKAETSILQTQTPVTVDPFVDTVSFVENLPQDEIFEVARGLVETGDYNIFKLGGVLVKINGEQWLNGYKNFNEMLEAEFPTLKRRKALYLMAIYTKLVAADISWDKVGHLGWTKLKELASVLNKDNVDFWVAKAEKLTLIQLMEAIKKSKMLDVDEAPESEEDLMTTISFKVHTSQKEVIMDALESAKVLAQTEYNSVALEGICLSYLTGANPTAPQTALADETLDNIIKAAGSTKVLTLVSELYPELSITVTSKGV